MVKRMTPYFRRLELALREDFPGCQADVLSMAAKEKWTALCQAHPEEPPELRAHTYRLIYPAIAAFEAMTEGGLSREDAAGLLSRLMHQRAEKAAAVLRSVLRIPGLYRVIPRFFSAMTKKHYGEKASFQAMWYSQGKRNMRFDMTACPYQIICAAHGCPEVVAAFCDADDVVYGHMHPRLCWQRTQTLGRGGACCDFHLFIISKEKNAHQ